jgi:hypothetical protein
VVNRRILSNYQPAHGMRITLWHRRANVTAYQYLIEMRPRNISGLLVESALIVFSVLFALFIDRAAEKAKTGRQKRVALERMQQELLANRELLTDAIRRHRRVVSNLNRVLGNERDSLRVKLLQKGYIDFILLSDGESIYPRLPTRTSWEAALSTGIIAEFDYGVVEALTYVYSSQEFITGQTFQNIVEDLYDVEATNPERKLLKLKLEFEELIAQEVSLQKRIGESLRRMRKLYNLAQPPVATPKQTTQTRP